MIPIFKYFRYLKARKEETNKIEENRTKSNSSKVRSKSLKVSNSPKYAVPYGCSTLGNRQREQILDIRSRMAPASSDSDHVPTGSKF